MNIKEAKQEIEKNVRIYLEKNKDGDYIVPVVRQRPVFMVGAPGIGKTAIMEQIAADLNIALISYSMTHHTRQSAIGLPYLKEVEYNGKKFMKSEYTMSEIIASVYDIMEKTGHKEGILFLDEINCMSETLAPAMLQFLQQKTFGNQKLPEGWVIVTAGNPPQFNKSVKTFDVATMDRLKMMDCKADFQCWKEYAYNAGVHPAILAFLEQNDKFFYRIATTVDGQKYVTARGWEDLSSELKAYERFNFPVTLEMIQEYITDSEATRSFDAYYDLFKKYRMDYNVDDIISGNAAASLKSKCTSASFDERLALIAMLTDEICKQARTVVVSSNALFKANDHLKLVKAALQANADTLVTANLHYEANQIIEELNVSKEANNMTSLKEESYKKASKLLNNYQKKIEEKEVSGNEEQYKLLHKMFRSSVTRVQNEEKKVSEGITNAYDFIKDAFGNNLEMTLFSNNMSVNDVLSRFIQRDGNSAFSENSANLDTITQAQNISKKIQKIKKAS